MKDRIICVSLVMFNVIKCLHKKLANIITFVIRRIAVVASKCQVVFRAVKKQELEPLSDLY